MRKLRNNELDRLSIEAFKTASKLPVTVILDNVRSLNNVGSVFRTSDAFRLEKIILCGITACPPHKEIHKTALGAEDSVDWEYYEDAMEAVQQLKTEHYTICSIEQVENSISLPDIKLSGNQKYALVFGNEVRGVQQNVVSNSDISIEIPQHGTKHSLNISVSAGIVMWEFYKQLSADVL
jgi:tRNA G18 (ribose-2'-O)-methylase SpoU